jgi:signal transduction protein with GAF and PtsI domain
MNQDHLKLDRALEDCISVLGADSGTIHIKEQGRNVLLLAASREVPEFVLRAVREVPWGKGMAGMAAQGAEPVIFCNIQNDSSTDIHPKARSAGVQGAIVVPMMLGSDVIGTIGIGSREERTFSADETGWLMEFGRRLANDLDEHRLAA